MFDYAIIGGGVVGSAILNKLTRLKQRCLLIELQEDIAAGASKANSGLVHAGFDAAPNTLKAKLNVAGHRMMKKLASELKIDYKQIGALVCGTLQDREKLKELLERGKQNKVKGLSIIGEKKLFKLAPNLNKEQKLALWAKTAGIISPYKFAIALCEEAALNGAQIKLGCQITKVVRTEKNVFSIFANGQTFAAKKIINCSGAGFNDVSTLLGCENFPLSFRRGEYFVLDKAATSPLTSITVFPLPTIKGKGILATPTIDGNILLGPTSEASLLDTKTTAEGLLEIKKGIIKLFDNFPSNQTIREYSGIRVQCGSDFIIQKSTINENVLNICGIDSPGLSSAPAIAVYVALLLGLDLKEKKMIRRKKQIVTNSLSKKKLDKLVKKDPLYGKIVCKCELVTEGEIRDAFLCPVPPKTIDGLKRRTRCGMGRCQGGFCMLKIATLIAKQNNIELKSVLKENNGSEIMPYEIKELEQEDDDNAKN